MLAAQSQPAQPTAGPSSSPKAAAPAQLASDESIIAPALDSFPPTGTPIHAKLAGYDFYRSLGSPSRIVAPMVDQSELAWRVLSRRYASHLVYTPMINAKLFVNEDKGAEKYRKENFDRLNMEEGARELTLGGGGKAEPRKDTDRPLIIQFCANDPDILLKAAQIVEGHCDGVDLNLGCPQHIARRGHYGAFLQEDWNLIFSLINILHLNLRVPVTAKMRVFPTLSRTIAYARMLERAGAQIVTVHGRTREMKGHKTGLADWGAIRAVKEALSVPVFANGNILYPADVDECLRETRADGVMSAEGNLYNPAIFMSPPAEPCPLFPHSPQLPFPDIIRLAHEYLDIVQDLKTMTGSSAVKSHLFRLCRPALETHKDLRAGLGKSRGAELGGEEGTKQFRAWLKELESRIEADRAAYIPSAVEGDPLRPSSIPHWLAQPYFRPPLPPTEAQNPEEALEKKAARKARKEAAQAVKNGERPDGKAEEKAEQVQQVENGRPVDIADVQTVNEEAVMGADKAPATAASKGHGEDGKRSHPDETGEPAGSEKVGGEKEANDEGKAGEVGEAGEDGGPQSKKLRRALEASSSLKTSANEHFQKKRFTDAIANYEDALAALPPRPKAEQVENESKSEGDENGEEKADSDHEQGRRPGRQRPERVKPVPVPTDLARKEKGKGKERQLDLAESSGSSGQDVNQEADEEQEGVQALLKECVKARAVLYANLAASYLKMEEWKQAVEACNEALLDDPNYIKALNRRATANENIGSWSSLSSAQDDYKLLSTLPSTPPSLRPAIQAALTRLPPLIKEQANKEKDEMMGKLKGLGDSLLGHFGLSTKNFQFNKQPGGGYSMNFVR